MRDWGCMKTPLQTAGETARKPGDVIYKAQVGRRTVSITRDCRCSITGAGWNIHTFPLKGFGSAIRHARHEIRRRMPYAKWTVILDRSDELL